MYFVPAVVHHFLFPFAPIWGLVPSRPVHFVSGYKLVPVQQMPAKIVLSEVKFVDSWPASLSEEPVHEHPGTQIKIISGVLKQRNDNKLSS